MKDSFLIRTEWKQHLELLTMEQRGELFTACFEYHEDAEPRALSPMVQMAFSFMRQFFDESAAKYAERVEANRKNGKNGGRPKKADGFCENPKNPVGFEETERFLEKPKKPDYEYDSDSEYESDSDCEVNKPRKRKMTEPKVQCAENVSMTNAEYQQLLDTHGPADTKRLVEILDNYKGSTGKKYKSDYRAILSWCVDKLNEEKSRKPKSTQAACDGDNAWIKKHIQARKEV